MYLLSTSLRHRIATKLLNESPYQSHQLARSLSFGEDTKDLKQVLTEKIPKYQEKVKKLLCEYPAAKIDDVTINTVYSGMRGLRGMLWEPSEMDPEHGIRFRCLSVSDVCSKLPKATGSNQPMPEGAFFLLLTGEIPTEQQAEKLSKELSCRMELPPSVMEIAGHLPCSLMPTCKMACLLTALSECSKFKTSGLCMDALEDALDLISKITSIAAVAYQKTYNDTSNLPPIDADKDWATNFTCMMDLGSRPDIIEFLRLYLTIQSDHEGGNVTAHTTHLLGSALCNPFCSYAAGLLSLCGPLNGHTDSEAFQFICDLVEACGETPADDDLKKYVVNYLKNKPSVPGFGHPFLIKTDPRFSVLKEFAEKNITDNPKLKIVNQLYNIVPPILTAEKKILNPWPTAGLITGVIMEHYGMKHKDFFAAVKGVARCLGTMASFVLHRVINSPMERPKSFTTDSLLQMAENLKRQKFPAACQKT